jgi:hypothetical protein
MITKTKLPLLIVLSLILLNQACKQPQVVKHSGEKDLISFKPYGALLIQKFRDGPPTDFLLPSMATRWNRNGA